MNRLFGEYMMSETPCALSLQLWMGHRLLPSSSTCTHVHGSYGFFTYCALTLAPVIALTWTRQEQGGQVAGVFATPHSFYMQVFYRRCCNTALILHASLLPAGGVATPLSFYMPVFYKILRCQHNATANKRQKREGEISNTDALMLAVLQAAAAAHNTQWRAALHTLICPLEPPTARW